MADERKKLEGAVARPIHRPDFKSLWASRSPFNENTSVFRYTQTLNPDWGLRYRGQLCSCTSIC
ncbi:hypothetical protein N7449_010384 [Penicillium cf. viridicatum]|uniref:Uncharacterized protein n=1 Tax=Penicillium cf. viridicatum TaxID=2972119 RepID=A0A9W9M335_9EURO|nr:hypothetical protein N7449_010384 [Penicillium cf. viridicatum]